MPSFVPRGLEPYQKNELLEKRIKELQSAIRSDAAPTRLAKAANKVRAAALAVIKAKQSIIASHPAAQTGLERHPHGEALARQWANLEQESEQWSSFSSEEIVARYSVKVS